MSITKMWLTLLPFKKYIWDKIKITRLATGWFLFVPWAKTLQNSSLYLSLLKELARSANSFNVRASPLTLIGIPLCAIAFSISSFEKSSSGEFFRPLTKVFLLWLKDARISRNISFSLSTCTGGFSYLTSWITALPTFGLGIKQFGGTLAIIWGFA